MVVSMSALQWIGALCLNSTGINFSFLGTLFKEKKNFQVVLKMTNHFIFIIFYLRLIPPV